MMNHIEHAKRVFEIEAEAVSNLIDNLDRNFGKSVDAILAARGRVIVCGMGKSGIIGKKISATFASTGTPSFSMHPGEAFHGDLGMVVKDDIFLAISNSGETDEILKLLPFLNDNKNLLISMTGNPDSTLARRSDLHLDISVRQEACPLKLAPTASTTATLAMGDALAVAIMKGRNFKSENFARFHPGGSLGRQLLTKVQDEMVKEKLPFAHKSLPFIELLSIVTGGEQGLAIIVDDSGDLFGVVTDGDVRRAMEVHQRNVFELLPIDLMTKTPITIRPEELVAEGVALMEKFDINKVLVVNGNKVVGILRK